MGDSCATLLIVARRLPTRKPRAENQIEGDSAEALVVRFGNLQVQDRQRIAPR